MFTMGVGQGGGRGEGWEGRGGEIGGGEEVVQKSISHGMEETMAARTKI